MPAVGAAIGTATIAATVAATIAAIASTGVFATGASVFAGHLALPLAGCQASVYASGFATFLATGSAKDFTRSAGTAPGGEMRTIGRNFGLHRNRPPPHSLEERKTADRGGGTP